MNKVPLQNLDTRNEKEEQEKTNLGEIRIIDSKGYNIEQFLCRCSDKTGDDPN